MAGSSLDLIALGLSTVVAFAAAANYVFGRADESRKRNTELREQIADLRDELDRVEGKLKNMEAQLEFARGDANFQRLRADLLYRELNEKRLGHGEDDG